MLFRDEHGGRLSLVQREHGSGGRRHLGDDERQVEFLAGLDSGADSGRAKTARRCDTAGCRGGGRDAHARTWPPSPWRSRSSGIVTGASVATGASSGDTIAYWPHRRKLGHFTQSVKIFSLTQRCGTIAKPI